MLEELEQGTFKMRDILENPEGRLTYVREPQMREEWNRLCAQLPDCSDERGDGVKRIFYIDRER